MIQERTLENVNSLTEEQLGVLYFKAMIKKSEEEIARGEYITLEEFDKEMEALYESSNTENSRTWY